LKFYKVTLKEYTFYTSAEVIYQLKLQENHTIKKSRTSGTLNYLQEKKNYFFLGAAFFAGAAFLGAAFLGAAFLGAAFFGAACLGAAFFAAAFLGAAFFAVAMFLEFNC
jgi:hypothetical protein